MLIFVKPPKKPIHSLEEGLFYTSSNLSVYQYIDDLVVMIIFTILVIILAFLIRFITIQTIDIILKLI